MTQQRRILAISSGGGHWVQLFRMRQAWDGHKVTYATAAPGLSDMLSADAAQRGLPCPAYFVIPEANRWQKVKMVKVLLSIAFLVFRIRPHVVVSTGASQGYFALRIGKILGAKTIWIDSIANAEEISMSGRLVRPYADVWLTQWEHLAVPEGPRFEGAVL